MLCVPQSASLLGQAFSVAAASPSTAPAEHSVAAATEPLTVCSDMGATLWGVTCERWLALNSLPEGE